MIDVIEVAVDISGLSENTYTGSVVIAGDASNSPLSISVTLVIEPLL